MSDTTSTIIIIILIIVLAYMILAIPAYIARNKGYSFLGFLIFSIVCFPAALIVSLILDDKNIYYESESDKAEALLAYKKLLDAGAITKEEFEEKKRELLG